MNKIESKKRIFTLDEKFKDNKKNYILQCLLASIILSGTLFCVESMFHTPIISSIGATTFIMFTLPNSLISRSRHVIGGYIIGIAVAFVFWNLGLILPVSMEILGGLSVGVAMFLMVVTNTEHPPAAALTLGAVIGGFNWSIAVFVFMVSIILVLIKILIGKWLIDLL